MVPQPGAPGVPPPSAELMAAASSLRLGQVAPFTWPNPDFCRTTTSAQTEVQTDADRDLTSTQNSAEHAGGIQSIIDD